MPATTEAIPRADPTETSMPPVTITIVMPMETMAIPESPSRVLEMLLVERKFFVVKDRMTARTMMTPRIVTSRICRTRLTLVFMASPPWPEPMRSCAPRWLRSGDFPR